MTFAEYLVAWAQLHGTQSPKGLVRVWLRIAFFLSTPLTKFNPNLITAFGPVLMGAAIYFASSPNRNYFLASITVLVVGLVDSFDGIVAVRTSKTSSWGAFLDGIVDRLIDVGIGILLIVLGAPVELAVLAISIALIHEYMRAKASGIGYREVGVITPAEKPTRIALGVMFLFAAGLLPEKVTQLANIATLVWIFLGLLSFAMLLRVYRKQLKK
ncbi:MAG: CDP-alcohol phosphatidyltransferase family protein [Actinobacteria bacterium]|nr:CDP-alcohol phosphatidyltransferase family protein [Actinomycetota bacterium]